MSQAEYSVQTHEPVGTCRAQTITFYIQFERGRKCGLSSYGKNCLRLTDNTQLRAWLFSLSQHSGVPQGVALPCLFHRCEVKEEGGHFSGGLFLEKVLPGPQASISKAKDELLSVDHLSFLCVCEIDIELIDSYLKIQMIFIHSKMETQHRGPGQRHLI